MAALGCKSSSQAVAHLLYRTHRLLGMLPVTTVVVLVISTRSTRVPNAYLNIKIKINLTFFSKKIAPKLTLVDPVVNT